MKIGDVLLVPDGRKFRLREATIIPEDRDSDIFATLAETDAGAGNVVDVPVEVAGALGNLRFVVE